MTYIYYIMTIITMKKAEDLRSHPSGFYKTFKPFLRDTEVHEPKWEKHHYQKHGEILKKDQQKSSQYLGWSVSTMANYIGGTGVCSLIEEDLAS